MNRVLLASAALLLLLPAAGAAAKSTDRNQAMSIDAGGQSGNLEGDGKTVLSGGVVVTQGSLEIRSSAAEIYMAGGEISRSVFTGKQVKMKQQMDNGSWMDAQADRVEYDMKTETITFIATTPSSPTAAPTVASAWSTTPSPATCRPVATVRASRP